MLKRAESGNGLVYGHRTRCDTIKRLPELDDRIIRQSECFRGQNPGLRNGPKGGIHAVKRQIFRRRHKTLVLRHFVQFPRRDQETHEFVGHVQIRAAFVDRELEIRHVKEDRTIIRHGNRGKGVGKGAGDKGLGTAV